MADLLLHKQTRAAAQIFLTNPTHALLLVAPEGSGKLSLSYYLASELLGADLHKIQEHSKVKIVQPEKSKLSISIEAVRELQQFTKLKTTGRRVIIIPDAQNMTGEAQNALLKMLEEPPADTIFIVTASGEQHLLPTVRSRAQKLEIRRPAAAESEKYFATLGFAAKDTHQAYLMSGGLVGLMHALLADAEHPLKQSVQTARQLLRATHFERLAKVDELAKQKNETLQVLFVLRQMSMATIEQAKDNRTIKRWHTVLQASYDAEEALLQNASAKLTLTNFMLVL
jgi:DNA polymerase-3 subunit delta'